MGTTAIQWDMCLDVQPQGPTTRTKKLKTKFLVLGFLPKASYIIHLIDSGNLSFLRNDAFSGGHVLSSRLHMATW